MSSVATSVAPAKECKKLKCRRIMLTINEVDKYEEIKKNMTERKCFRYLIAGKEIAPETGHEHIHMYVEFTCPINISKKMCCNQHVDVVKSKNQAIDYCQKECNVLDEIGEQTHQGCHTVQELLECKNPGMLDPRMFKTWQQVKHWNQAHTAAEWYCPNKEVIWLYGDSGVGKTKRAIEMVGDNLVDRVKFANGFWHSVSYDEDVKWCIYDDFRDSHMHPSELINFCDYYRNTMNVKGGSVLNHYDHIIITSVQNPHDIYPNMKDEEPKQQWLRRIKIIHMEKFPN